MPDTRPQGLSASYPRRENVFIDSYRILDSCKDKDCFEDTRVILTDMGQEVLERCGSLRVRETKVVWTDISTEPVKFNRGFFQVNIRFFTKVILEACVSAGRVQEIEGIAVTEKKVVLYGGEGNVNIFRSSDLPYEFCTYGTGGESVSSNKPIIVVEVVDPIALSVKVTERNVPSCVINCCCCSVDELPVTVTSVFNGNFSDIGTNSNKVLSVSLGFFSIVRLERPAQFIVSGTEYSIPDKVCCKPEEEDPCKLFAKMSFPVNEFGTSCANDNK